MKSLCALLVVAIIQGAIGQESKFAEEPKESNIVLPGEEVTLSCITSSEARCSWDFNVPGLDLTTAVIFDEYSVTLADGSLERRDPESKTDCSIVIPSVAERHMGSYTCTPYFRGLQSKSTTARVIVAARPTSFAFTGELAGATELTTGTVDPITITCEAREGRPKAELHWYLGERKLTDNVSEAVDVNDAAADLVTGSSTLTYQFEQQDEGAQLRCQALHPSYDNGQQEIALTVAVQFAPFRAEGSDLGTLYGFTEGEDKNLTVNFTSNPAPSTIQWRIGADVFSAGQQTPDGRVTAGPLEQVDAESHKYTLRLTFSPVEADYQNTTIALLLGNPLGEQELTMMVDADAPPPAPSAAPRPDPEGNDELPAMAGETGSAEDTTKHGGVSGGAIGGIIAAIIILLVLIALVAFARSRGKLCFAAEGGGDTRKEWRAHMDPEAADKEGHDNPGHEQKPDADATEHHNGTNGNTNGNTTGTNGNTNGTTKLPTDTPV